MWKFISATILGFTLAAFMSVLMGYSEPIWEGKGFIAFAYVGLLFLSALILTVMLLRGEIHRSVTYQATKYSMLSVLIGAISYPITIAVTFLVPDWISTLGLESVTWLLSVLFGEVILISIPLICSTLIAVHLNRIFD
jgi:hypothetical protein